MPVNCELEPDALEQQLSAAKVKVKLLIKITAFEAT